MIEFDKTVFVLGAGASKPYGFPLGKELKDQILREMTDTQILARIKSLGMEGQIEPLREVLKLTTMATVDEILEKKPSLRALGSYLIAHAILGCELPDRVLPMKDWYARLFAKMDFPNQPKLGEHLSFVTLNYDRSLEYFLDKAIEVELRESEVEKAHEIRRNVKVIHAHGSLGPYPECPYMNWKEERANPKMEEDLLQAAADGIKIVSDSLENSKAFETARQEIERADRVIIIGFGYHPTTLQNLFGDPSGKRITGTIQGINDEARLDEIKSFFGMNDNTRIDLHCELIANSAESLFDPTNDRSTLAGPLLV